MYIKHLDFERLKDEVFEFLRHRIDDVESMKFYSALRVLRDKGYRDEFQKETGFDLDRILNWIDGESGRKRDDATKEGFKEGIIIRAGDFIYKWPKSKKDTADENDE